MLIAGIIEICAIILCLCFIQGATKNKTGGEH